MVKAPDKAYIDCSTHGKAWGSGTWSSLPISPLVLALSSLLGLRRVTSSVWLWVSFSTTWGQGLPACLGEALWQQIQM